MCERKGFGQWYERPENKRAALRARGSRDQPVNTPAAFQYLNDLLYGVRVISCLSRLQVSSVRESTISAVNAAGAATIVDSKLLLFRLRLIDSNWGGAAAATAAIASGCPIRLRYRRQIYPINTDFAIFFQATEKWTLLKMFSLIFLTLNLFKINNMKANFVLFQFLCSAGVLRQYFASVPTCELG